ncbi:hypothetical protein TI04_09155 [Achromatium sp. WMS2]|nr:hypothetical protein TI04_09155 [Achromatium sp. WMS2]
MKKISAVLIVFLFVSSNNVHAWGGGNWGSNCEKWKSEIASSVWNIGKYMTAYSKYISGAIDQSTFRSKADDAIGDLERVLSRVDSVESCAAHDGKYQRRHDLLSNSLHTVLPLMRVGEIVSSVIYDRLRSSE